MIPASNGAGHRRSEWHIWPGWLPNQCPPPQSHPDDIIVMGLVVNELPFPPSGKRAHSLLDEIVYDATRRHSRIATNTQRTMGYSITSMSTTSRLVPTGAPSPFQSLLLLASGKRRPHERRWLTLKRGTPLYSRPSWDGLLVNQPGVFSPMVLQGTARSQLGSGRPVSVYLGLQYLALSVFSQSDDFRRCSFF